MSSSTDAFPHLSSGRIRALAVGSERRESALPDTPTLGEQWPGFVSTTWFAVVAPPDTPLEIREQLSEEIRKAFQAPEAARRLSELHATAVLNTPAEAARVIGADTQMWGAVIKANNIQGD